ncbi:hypothetical protein Tco_0756881 [Tanacetum coccineum]
MLVIEQPIPPAPAVDFEANVLAKWNAVYDAHNEVACLMLGSMTPELHRQFENYAPYEMLQKLIFIKTTKFSNLIHVALDLGYYKVFLCQSYEEKKSNFLFLILCKFDEVRVFANTKSIKLEVIYLSIQDQDCIGLDHYLEAA